MKRHIAAVLIFSFLAVSGFAEQVWSFRVSPGAVVPLRSKNTGPGFGANAGIDWAILSFTGLSLSGGLSVLPVIQGSYINLFEGGLGPLFQRRFTDRFSLRIQADLGFYQLNWNGEQSFRGKIGTGLSAAFHVLPYLSLFTGVSYTWYSDEPSLNTVGLGGGISLNLNELLGHRARVRGEMLEQRRVFPVSYAWYENNPIAYIKVTNDEPNTITAINCSFFLERFMNRPTIFAGIPALKPGESAEVPVTALFNESMMNLTENINANAQLSIDYRSLGARKQASFPLRMPVFHRNAMTWDDDRRASSFVSAQDPAARLFARHIASIVDERMRPDIPRNMQYALGLFEALNVYGMNYIIDPSSSYVEMKENASSLDSLNYPYQTLYYRGGDCDDLSILFCSLLEVLGIDTAFITIPGHIFIAFDSGMNDEEAASFFSPGDLIYYMDTYWTPLEVTVLGEGFYYAWKTGGQEWRNSKLQKQYRNETNRSGESDTRAQEAGSRSRAADEDLRPAERFSALYPMTGSWEVYPPVSVPDSALKTRGLPDSADIIPAIEASLDVYSSIALARKIRDLENQIASNAASSSSLLNRLGNLYGSAGILNKAEESFTRSDSSRARLNLANLNFIRGNFPEALNRYRELLHADAGNALALLGLARSAYELRDYPSVDAAYRELAGINAGLASLYPYLGAFEETGGKPASYADRLSTTIWAREDWEAGIESDTAVLAKTLPGLTKQISIEN
ncbi:MAG: hypothetical protein LBG22_00180 [Treponema sp.]|nr:hypothetical protein [Treponema sp.]